MPRLATIINDYIYENRRRLLVTHFSFRHKARELYTNKSLDCDEIWVGSLLVAEIEKDTIRFDDQLFAKITKSPPNGYPYFHRLIASDPNFFVRLDDVLVGIGMFKSNA